MIKSQTFSIKKIDKFDNDYIEKELSKLCSNIVRYAIVDIDDTDIYLTVSYLQ